MSFPILVRRWHVCTESATRPLIWLFGPELSLCLVFTYLSRILRPPPNRSNCHLPRHHSTQICHLDNILWGHIGRWAVKCHWVWQATPQVPRPLTSRLDRTEGVATQEGPSWTQISQHPFHKKEYLMWISEVVFVMIIQIKVPES